MPRILSGLQPSGKLHIGNYFGSMRPNIDLAQQHDESFIMIADLHALNTIRDQRQMQENITDMILDFLACGLDPDKTIFFKQSAVHHHAELTWILSTLTPLGILERAHAFKDKKSKGLDVTAGLFTYPILMTCDILLYDPHLIPVGKDQKQHVEMARDIALKFNHIYGEAFPILPEPLISEQTGIIPGIDGQKMSKSYQNTIEIFASEKKLRKQVMSIVTDSKSVEEPKDPNQCNVFALAKFFFSESELSELEAKYLSGRFGYGDAKKWLFENMNAYFSRYREKRESLASDPQKLREIIENGNQRAREHASQKMKIVKEMVGIG